MTEISGRGVGMDVVQSVLQRLKGTVDVDSRPGLGTTFRLRLPLTLAIIKALLFRVEQRLYAIPLNAVVEISRNLESEVHQVDHYEVLTLRNEVLPLVRLGRVSETGLDSRKLFVLVINVAERKFGLIVDSLDGEEELVIKALDGEAISTDLVSGASIMGDGRVVLILNLAAVIDHFARSRSAGTRTPISGLLLSRRRPGSSGPRRRRRPRMKSPVRVLVVDDSALMRKLIPQIIESDDSIQVVGTAMDGSFGLRKLEELNPDVVTLDLEMPGMSGIDMLKAIMRQHPVPVIVVSSHSTEGASITLKALGLGAFDFVAKPNDVSTRMSDIALELIAKIKAAAQARECTLLLFHLRSTAAKPRRLTPNLPPCQPVSSPSACPRADRTLSNTFCLSCPAIFPAPSWSCSTCQMASPTYLPAA